MAKEIKMGGSKVDAPQQPRVDISNTTMVMSEDGNLVFGEGFLLRKVSKFLIGAEEDGIIPIPVLYDVKTGKPLWDSVNIPDDIKQEYKEFYESNK